MQNIQKEVLSVEASSAVPIPPLENACACVVARAGTPSLEAQSPDKSPTASQVHTDVGTCTVELSVHSALSGDMIAFFPEAPTSWTGAEIKQRLAEEAPLQQYHFYKLLHRSELLDARLSLAECSGLGASCGKVELLAIVREIDADAVMALQAATDVLDKVDKRSIAEIKAFARPPDMVMKTMCAVMTVLDKTPSWAQCKVELNDKQFLRRIKDFDKDNITDATLRKIGKYVSDPNFTPKLVQNVSMAAGALCQWVHAIKVYAEVYRKVVAE